ncbi:MAG TPA: hypothetical protein VN229_12895 [Terriglobales bacterium]|nr:hypothetical protein [Terriglobales bacterium]
MGDEKRAQRDDQAADTDKAGSPSSDAKSRAERQAEELRRNLQRRKAQQRQRRTQDDA